MNKTVQGNIAVGLYRGILRLAREKIDDFDLSNGLMTFRDVDHIDRIFVDRYLSKYKGVNTFTSGPYENKGTNVVSWIKVQIRERPLTKKNMDELFQIHRDFDEIVWLTRHHDTVTRYEY